MPGSRRAALLAAAIALAAAGCNDELCTRDSECNAGFVCTREALCAPAPDAGQSPGGGDGGSGPADGGLADAAPLDAAGVDAAIDASPVIDAGDEEEDDGLDL